MSIVSSEILSFFHENDALMMKKFIVLAVFELQFKRFYQKI